LQRGAARRIHAEKTLTEQNNAKAAADEKDCQYPANRSALFRYFLKFVQKDKESAGWGAAMSESRSVSSHHRR